MKTEITLTNGKVIEVTTNPFNQVSLKEVMEALNCDSTEACELLDALECDVHYGYVHHGYAHKLISELE